MATKYSDNFKVILVTEHKIRTDHIHVAPEHLQLHKKVQVSGFHPHGDHLPTATVQHLWGNNCCPEPQQQPLRQEKAPGQDTWASTHPSGEVPWALRKPFTCSFVSFRKTT